MLPELGELLVSQQGEVRLRLSLAQSEQRGRGHYGIAEPVHATHQDPVGGRSRQRTGVSGDLIAQSPSAVAGSGNAPAAGASIASNGCAPRTSWRIAPHRRFERLVDVGGNGLDGGSIATSPRVDSRRRPPSRPLPRHQPGVRSGGAARSRQLVLGAQPLEAIEAPARGCVS